MSDGSSKAPIPPIHSDAISSGNNLNSHQSTTEKNYGPVSAVFITLLAFFGSQLFVGLIISLLPAFFGIDEPGISSSLVDSALNQFLMILAIELVMLWIIWRFMRRRKIAMKSIGIVRLRLFRDISAALAGYAAYFVLFIIIMAVAKAIFPELDMTQEQEIGFSKYTTGYQLWFVFISLVILPPIAEEITVRGFLYTGLRNKLPIFVAAIITSVIFAAAHLQWGSGNALLWSAALDTFALSMILIYLRQKTSSLWPAIFVHMMKNGLAFTLLFVFKL